MNKSPVIIHVDDDERCLELSRTSFEWALPNVEVVTRNDPEEALATLSLEAVDALVSDSIELADGTPFVEAARNAYPGLPTVLYTGSAFGAVSPVISRAGVTEYVQKSADGSISGLVSRIERLVDTDASRSTTEQFRYTAPDGGRTSATGTDGHDEEWTDLDHCDPTSVDELLMTFVDVLGGRADERPLLELFDVEALAEVFSSHDDTASMQFRVRIDTHEILLTSSGVVATRPLTSV